MKKLLTILFILLSLQVLSQKTYECKAYTVYYSLEDRVGERFFTDLSFNLYDSSATLTHNPSKDSIAFSFLYPLPVMTHSNGNVATGWSASNKGVFYIVGFMHNREGRMMLFSISDFTMIVIYEVYYKQPTEIL